MSLRPRLTLRFCFCVAFVLSAPLCFANGDRLPSGCLLAMMANAEMNNPKIGYVRQLWNFVSRKQSKPFYEGEISKRIYEDANSYYMDHEAEFNFKKEDGELIHYLDLSREQYREILERMAKDIEKSTDGSKAIRDNLARMLRKHEDTEPRRLRFDEPKIKKTRAELQTEFRKKALTKELSLPEAITFFNYYKMSLLKNRNDKMLYCVKEIAKLEHTLKQRSVLSSEIDEIRSEIFKVSYLIHTVVLEEMTQDLEGVPAQDFMAKMGDYIRMSEGRLQPYVPEKLRDTSETN